MKRKVEYRGFVNREDMQIVFDTICTSPRWGAVVYADFTFDDTVGAWLVELWTVERITHVDSTTYRDVMPQQYAIYKPCDLPAVAKRLGLTEVVE